MRKHEDASRTFQGHTTSWARSGAVFQAFLPPRSPITTLSLGLSFPFLDQVSVAAGLSGVLKGSKKLEIVKMLWKEKSWTNEQFGQSLIN